jgi:hypothetical protein
MLAVGVRMNLPAFRGDIVVRVPGGYPLASRSAPVAIFETEMDEIGVCCYQLRQHQDAIG